MAIKSVPDLTNLFIAPLSGQTVDAFVVHDSSGNVALEIEADGSIVMPNLPTSDPTSAGQLYTSSEVLSISAGA